MLETVVKQEIIFYVMGVLMMSGVLAKLVSYFSVRGMVKAAREIQKSNHRLMKLVRAKFEHASMISDKVQNVEAFVEKYIYEYKVLGIRLGGWCSFPKKILWITSILGTFAIFESYRMVGVSDLMLKYIQWTGVFVLSLLLLSFVTEESLRLDAAKNYMVEYLENVCIHRYAKLHRAEESKETEEKVDDVEEKEEAKVDTAQTHQEEQRKNEQEMRIRAILEEFLA